MSLHCPKAEKAKVVCIHQQVLPGGPEQREAPALGLVPLGCPEVGPRRLLSSQLSSPQGAGLPSSTPGVPRHPPDSPGPQTHSISFCYPAGSLHIAKHAGGWWDC